MILPAVVGEGEQQLAQANSLVEGAGNITNLLGPALAGVLIALARRGERDVARRSVVPDRVRPIVGLFVRVGHGVQDEGRTRDAGGIWAGLAYLRHDVLLARVSLSSLTFGFLFPMLGASLPVLAYQQYDHNPRVAGLLFAVIGGGQVVGSLLAFRLVTRVPPACAWRRSPRSSPPRRSGCSSRTCRSGSSALALAICGASIPLINAPYLGMLSMRVPRALRGKVLQSLITINQLAGPLGYLIAGTALRRNRPARHLRADRRPRDVREPQLHRRRHRGSPLPKKRLDVLLVERGLAESRAQAQALVMAGRVPGHSKAGRAGRRGRGRSRSTRPPPYVSRAGHKLANALDAFGVDVAGLDCLDVGASTGGFTDVLLQRGAARVIALDVGYGQLHDKIRRRPARDRARAVERALADRAAVRAAARHLRRLVHLGASSRCRRRSRLAAPGWQALVLVKPQFEAGRAEAPKGVVRDPEVRRRVVREVAEALARGGRQSRAGS